MQLQLPPQARQLAVCGLDDAVADQALLLACRRGQCWRMFRRRVHTEHDSGGRAGQYDSDSEQTVLWRWLDEVP